MNVCDACIPRKGKAIGRTPMYWWKEDIAKLRRNRQEAENIPLAFKSRRKELHKAIQDSKNKSFKLRRDDLQNNPIKSL